MSEFLKGNFKVKRPVTEQSPAAEDKKKAFKEEFKRKALQSVGGSMVFVEMDMLSWDPEQDSDKNKKS